MTSLYTRRQALAAFGLSRFAFASESAKPMRGIFIILATPFTESKAVDFEDLAREVDFMARSGVQGMVWPQLASEYMTLSREERLRGMTVLSKAAEGKPPALVLGVQGAGTAAALDYVKHAETLNPDALIAIPPTEAKSVSDFRDYYRAIAKATTRPLFVQTTGGAKGITPPVEMLVELAREFPHCGYIKEEAEPVIERMTALAKHRPAVKSVFSGAAGKGLMYELSLGFDGTMPGAPYPDIYAQIWEMYQSGKKAAARDLFAKLLLMINLDQQTPGARQYMMKKRGVFKTAVSRRQEFHLTPAAIAEIDFCWEALKPYARV
jgi:4-hydroxy-tetrahydrodipicolinate synthase